MSKADQTAPNPQQAIRGLEFMARQLVEGFITGMHQSPNHGFSVEFAEHKLYNPGQSVRHIDWKVFARTDRLYTRSYEEETNLRCMLLVDQSSSMYYPAPGSGKLRFAAESAAALAWLLHQQRDATGLCLFDREIRLLSPARSSRSALDKLITSLEQTLSRPAPKLQSTGTAEILHEIAEKIPRRSLVVLFTDMFDDSEDPEAIFHGLQHLRHKKHEVLMFHVFDSQTESDFTFDNRPHKFIDLETGEVVRLQPAQVREAFIRQSKEMHERLATQCHQLRIDLVRADIHAGVQAVLQAYLIKRNKMY